MFHSIAVRNVPCKWSQNNAYSWWCHGAETQGEHHFWSFFWSLRDAVICWGSIFQGFKFGSLEDRCGLIIPLLGMVDSDGPKVSFMAKSQGCGFKCTHSKSDPCTLHCLTTVPWLLIDTNKMGIMWCTPALWDMDQHSCLHFGTLIESMTVGSFWRQGYGDCHNELLHIKICCYIAVGSPCIAAI